MNEVKERALQKAMRLCSRSEKCAKEIREKLRLWEVPNELHEVIITDLYDKKFLDDKRFAESFAHDKIYLSKWGKQKVAFTLRMKDIAAPQIDEALAEIDEERYLELLVDILQKKKPTIKAKNDYEHTAKLIRYGQGRGFTTSEINRALNEIL